MKKMRMEGICNLERYKTLAGARRAIAYLKRHGIKAATEAREISKEHAGSFYGGQGVAIFVSARESRKAGEILYEWARKRKDLRSLTLCPEEGTLDFLEMLIHDCRQYLMIATGEIKDISEEGVLELDDPSGDIEIITLRLKRLKDQCMRMAGRRPLDWLRYSSGENAGKKKNEGCRTAFGRRFTKEKRCKNR